MPEDRNRVLNRRGAHQLTPEEVDRISGGEVFTRLTRIMTGPPSNPDVTIDT